jgi:hypothetical protein
MVALFASAVAPLVDVASPLAEEIGVGARAKLAKASLACPLSIKSLPLSA